MPAIALYVCMYVSMSPCARAYIYTRAREVYRYEGWFNQCPRLSGTIISARSLRHTRSRATRVNTRHCDARARARALFIRVCVCVFCDAHSLHNVVCRTSRTSANPRTGTLRPPTDARQIPTRRCSSKLLHIPWCARARSLAFSPSFTRAKVEERAAGFLLASFPDDIFINDGYL